MTTITTVILSALVGGIVSYVLAVINNVLNARSKIDESLRLERLRVYKPLWTKTGVLPQWPRKEGVTYGALHDVSKAFRAWYFEEGGIYLSKQARVVYGNVQEALNTLGVHEASEVISDADYENLRVQFSKLRTELTKDLLSRQRVFLVS
jgi:hypothetical protein